MKLLRGIHNLHSIKKQAAHRGCVLSVGVGFNNGNGIHLGCSAIFSLKKAVK